MLQWITCRVNDALCWYPFYGTVEFLASLYSSDPQGFEAGLQTWMPPSVSDSIRNSDRQRHSTSSGRGRGGLIQLERLNNSTRTTTAGVLHSVFVPLNIA